MRNCDIEKSLKVVCQESERDSERERVLGKI